MDTGETEPKLDMDRSVQRIYTFTMPSAATQFNPDTARKYQKKAIDAVRTRRANEIVRDAVGVSKLVDRSKWGEMVRSNMAQSILVQSAILRQQQPTQFKHLLGKGRKPGILDVCERLASAASTVFQWGKDESQALISIGSFVQITQAPQNCGVPSTTQSVPAPEQIQVSTPAEQVIDVLSSTVQDNTV